MQTIRETLSQPPSMLKNYYRTVSVKRPGYTAEDFVFPTLEICWNNVKINKRQLRRYQGLCQLENSSVAPVLYPHVLMGGIHLALLSHEAFPMSVLGGLHLHTETIQHRALQLDEGYDISASIKRYRIVRQGFEFDLDTHIKVAGKTIWESRNSYLLPGKYEFNEQQSLPSTRRGTLVNAEAVDNFAIPWLIGKRYALLTGDINPIHMNRIAAMALGQKQDIAHAMWALATAIGKQSDLLQGEQVYLSASFKGPLHIGKGITVKSQGEKSHGAFDLYCGDNQRPSICALLRKSLSKETLT